VGADSAELNDEDAVQDLQMDIYDEHVSTVINALETLRKFVDKGKVKRSVHEHMIAHV
jgi:hypothetical protein